MRIQIILCNLRMKKLIFCLLLLPAFTEVNLCAWNKREHAAIAIIAENHLSPKAKKNVREISGGHLAEEASYLDEHRNSMLPIRHLLCVDENFQCELEPVLNERGQKNVLVHIQDCISELKHYKELDDSTRRVDLYCIVHLIGDIHCPGHVLYKDGRSEMQWVKFSYEGDDIYLHRIWDGPVTEYVSGGPLDLAYICDVATKREISKIQEGSLIDWGQEIATRCQNVNLDVPANHIIDDDYLMRNWPLARQELTYAGYRLAKILNEIFR